VNYFVAKYRVPACLRRRPTPLLLLLLAPLLTGSANVIYNYDAAGRLQSVTYDDGSTVTYTLDAAGNRTTVATTPPKPLTAPGSIAAAPQSASQIKLTWTASSGGSGVAGYNVYRGGTLITPSGITGLSYTDAGLTPNTLYSNYTAVAYDHDGNTSPASTSASAKTCPLPTISSFSGSTASSSQINLTWSAGDSCGLGLSSYKIYRDGSLIATITTPSATSYSDTGLAAVSSHSYTLYAYDSGGSSVTATANAGTYPLPSISSFTATTNGASSITLAWSATDSGGPGGLTYSVTNTTLNRAVSGCTASPCSDTGLSAGTNYAYQLTVQDSVHDPATASASAWTLPGAPGTPSVSAITATTATVSWTAASGTVTSYAYSINGGSSWTNVGTALTASLTGLTQYTNYTVEVRASNAAGNGTSSSASFTTWHQITDANGKVLSGASSVYNSVINYGTCFGGSYNGYMELLQSYGSKSMVASIVSLQPCQTACPTGGVTSNLSSGYQRPSNNSCEIDASPSAYGH
jgi:YD repeat-containing protein